jgi:putative endonuclease
MIGIVKKNILFFTIRTFFRKFAPYFLTMAEHNILGKIGEDEAVRFLMAKGYVIRHRDWHCGKKDLDIVAEKDHELIIVEVKTRTDERFGSPEDAVTPVKIRRIIASTEAYLQTFELDMPVRFDIVSVTGKTPPFHVEHIMNAFYPPIW